MVPNRLLKLFFPYFLRKVEEATAVIPWAEATAVIWSAVVVISSEGPSVRVAMVVAGKQFCSM